MKNRIDLLTDEEIIKLLNESKSFRDFMIKLGYKNTNGSGRYDSVKKILLKRGIEIKKYEKFLYNKDFKRISDDVVFCEKSTYSRSHLKKRIIDQKLIDYKCRECGNDGIWKDKKLVLQLEHINGINNDNRIENLCFLCPNCHTQTDTYSGKALKKHHYCDCGNEILKGSDMCKKCNHENQRKVIRPEYDILIDDLEKTNYSAVGRKYGVSDNCIRKWIRKYENGR